MSDQDELLIDLPSEGSAVDVDVEPLPDDPQEDSEAPEEHEQYSKKVKKRIDKLTRERREAERQQDAALQYAKSMQQENSALKSRVQSLDAGYVNEYGDRIASQSEALEREFETAIATGDTSAQVELNKKIAQLAIEEERVKAAKLQQAQAYQEPSQDAAPSTPPQATPQVPSRPDPKAEEWAERNDWFGEDSAMTFAAFGIHKALVEDEAFDTNSPEYYSEIDRRMREAFPHKFNGEVSVSTSQSRRPQQAVASATRHSSAVRKTVRLNPSEVAIAKKLGVPLEEYAKYKR